MVIIAFLIATVVPLLFFYMIYALDLYSSGSIRAVFVCFIWGLISFFPALVINGAVGLFVPGVLLTVLIAPVLEEILKSLGLVYYGRRPDFTYFVDGAIYGFAAGIAFSIFENYLYLFNPAGGQGGLIIVRAFSTCLMHGSASALVGIAIGRLRFGRGRERFVSLLFGWGMAFVLHATFNYIVFNWFGVVPTLVALAIGLGGVGLIALFIFMGLRVERGWIEETLGLSLGVTDREVEVVMKLDSLDELLRPIVDRFGEKRARMVERFLLKQAQLGIKRKAWELAEDARLKAEIEEQVQQLQREMERLRQKVGVYCMIYVRSIFPQEATYLWRTLENHLQARQGKEVSYDLWKGLEEAAKM